MYKGTHLRVLFINDVAFVVSTLLGDLSKLGVDATVAGHQPRDPTLGRLSFARVCLRAGSTIARKRTYDLLHINYGLFGFLGWTSIKPVVLHLHGSDIRPGSLARSKIANLVSRLSARKASQVWYSTTDLSAHLRGIGAPCMYMPNPVAHAFFSIPQPPPDRPNVLFAIPLTSLKGAERGIDAMRLLAEELPDLSVSAFGFGPDASAAQPMQRRMPSSVHVLPWTPREKMPALFSRATVVVGRFGLGSLGMTELEAMASGRPLVAEISQSHREMEPYYREDPPVFSCEDFRSVVETVHHLLDDRALAERVGTESRKWAERYHSSSIVAKLYREEYSKLEEIGG